MKDKSVPFFDAIQEAKNILVLDLGFLGDTVHLVPSLACIRRALPKARLEVMTSQHVTDLLKLLPWVDRALGYPRFPKGPKWYQDFVRVKALRKERYDAVINLNGSDRSSLLTFMSGAPLRLGRIPPKMHAIWPHYFTHRVWEPFALIPIFRQKLHCLAKAGFPDTHRVEFNVTIPADTVTKVCRLLEGIGPLIHISPFTTQDSRELPGNVLAEFINTWRKRYPEFACVISCAPTEREKSKLVKLLEKLNRPPEKIFAGELNTLELATVIGKSELHIGGDSGGMHLAVMMGRPALTWFRHFREAPHWLPEGSQHRVVWGTHSERGLQGLHADTLMKAFNEML